MKHLFTAIACCLVVACFGQGTTIHEYPWNPDWNNDNFVGSSDLTGFLSVYGSEYGNPPEPCDYDGTPLEDLMFSIYDGTVVLDSIFMEYQLEDIASYYDVGCPDPITDTVIVSNSVMLSSFELTSSNWRLGGYDASGHYHYFQFEWNTSEGWYKFILGNYLVTIFDGFFEGSYQSTTPEVQLPLPSTWNLDADGIHFENTWSSYHWAYYANYLHILPYWHYAE